jgi:hypothetical protein
MFPIRRLGLQLFFLLSYKQKLKFLLILNCENSQRTHLHTPSRLHCSDKRIITDNHDKVPKHPGLCTPAIAPARPHFREIIIGDDHDAAKRI